MTAGRSNAEVESHHWGTPKKYVDAVRSVFNGEILLDPCSNEWSIVNAKTEWALPQVDGLRKDWCFGSIFVNPPYGSDRSRGTRIIDWLEKCSDAHTRYRSEVIALVPVAANTKHWKKHVWPKATGVSFLYDTRLRFLENGRDVGKGAPMACAMIYWGKDFEKFSGYLSQYGATLDIRNAELPEGSVDAQSNIFTLDGLVVSK